MGRASRAGHGREREAQGERTEEERREKGEIDEKGGGRGTKYYVMDSGDSVQWLAAAQASNDGKATLKPYVVLSQIDIE